MMHTVYICGPMTGLPENNYPAFIAEERRLRVLGHDVINPARTGEQDTARLVSPDWHDFLASAICRMRNATAIRYLDGHTESYGAKIEAIVADRMVLSVIDGD